MKRNIVKKLVGPYFTASLIVTLLCTLGLFYLQPYAGVAAAVLTVILCVFYRQELTKENEVLGEYLNSVTQDLENTVRPLLMNNPMPLCLVNENGLVIWFNQKFQDIYRESKMFSSNLTELTGVRLFDFEEKEGEFPCLDISRDEKRYQVIATPLDGEMKGQTMLHWQDVTELDGLRAHYAEEKVCYCYILVDNFDELIESSPDERKSLIASQIETTIRQWLAHHGTAGVKYRDDRYFAAFLYKEFERIESGKFAILDEVRAIETDADFPASLSIGFGLNGKNLAETEQFAVAALDLALGRGGDQAVVRKRSRVEYFGGRLQAVEKRNKGKSRIVAHALRQMIDQANDVMIMGHKNADLDSFGSALGIYRMVKTRGKDAAVLIENTTTLGEIFEQVQDTGNYKFVRTAEARNMVDKETLLVVVDTCRTSLVECAELLALTDKIVVVDHHRKTEDNIDHATLTYTETYASSAAELITEIFQYMGGGKKPIEKLEAELLLAGITLDTKNFSIRTGVRTFEAASWLRRNGAEIIKVKQMFQVDKEIMKKRAGLLAKAEILSNGCALTFAQGAYSQAALITAQTADELLNMKGIRASFAVLQNQNDKCVISARSLGDINVQTLLETLGGGGHLSMAGAQVDLSLEETVEKLRELIAKV